MKGDALANLEEVDWSKLPPPADDGAAAHLTGFEVPDIALLTTSGQAISFAKCRGLTVVYAYPRTGSPGETELVENWDQIPGARGCTPQACAFRDHAADLGGAGASHLFGFSTENSGHQRETVERLHLPFPLVSDERLAFARALRLPVFHVDGEALLKRLTMIIDGGRIAKVFYPVFPPDRNASDVLEWLRANPR